MALDFCKKDDYGCHVQKLNGFRYRTFFRGRKSACKSTAVRQIIIKKSISREISLQRDDDDENLGFEKKRKLGCETIPVKKSQLCSGVVQKDVPLNSKIWSGEYSNKRRRKKEETGAGIRKSRDVISGCGSVDQYENLKVISHGTYGIVYRARDKKTGEIVAIKEEFDGLSIPSLREIDILKSLHCHPSIVEFKQVVVDDYDGVYVVMEYLEHDLKRYITNVGEKHLSPIEVKCLMKQLLEGVKFLHDNRVMHRDLKPSNILINNRGRLKICDFGLSRRFGSTLGSYSPHVGTLWYRAPELLLGAKTYSSAIDMWSVGCIMAELLLKQVLFRGRQSDELGQLETIYRILGTPDEAVWPGLIPSLPGANAQFVNQPYNLLWNEFAAADITDAGFDILNRFLTYDPAKRITAECALNHAWFQEYLS